APADPAGPDPAPNGVRAHPATMRAHGTAVSATAMSAAAVSTTTVSTTTVSTTTVSACTGRGNGWGKGDRCTDCGGGGNAHEALSEHDLASPGPPPPRRF